jgi:hypothetical protein
MDVPQQTINTFFNNAVIRDFSRDYLFRVDSINFDNGALITPTGLLYAKTAKLPGRNIVNQQVKYAGQTFNIPGSVEYPGAENYSLEFYCPENSDIREILMNESTRTFGNIFGIAGSGQSGGSIANANSVITLLQLNKNLDALFKYRLIGCSIREVGEVSYSMAEGNGAVMSFTVGIAYHFFDRQALDRSAVTPLNR